MLSYRNFQTKGLARKGHGNTVFVTHYSTGITPWDFSSNLLGLILENWDF